MVYFSPFVLAYNPCLLERLGSCQLLANLQHTSLEQCVINNMPICKWRVWCQIYEIDLTTKILCWCGPPYETADSLCVKLMENVVKTVGKCKIKFYVCFSDKIIQDSNNKERLDKTTTRNECWSWEEGKTIFWDSYLMKHKSNSP